ncbi:MAG: hypothetical protein KUG72_10335 [Pseudomonadales bacterium]|nr:hypothetical protein [Pseudomonadales bacterium]
MTYPMSLPKKILATGFALLITSHVLLAEEQLIQLESSQILGNQEQPGILYIVPWGQPNRSDFLSQSITPTVNVDGVLKPVDPQTISREFNYYKKVQLLSRSESN